MLATLVYAAPWLLGVLFVVSLVQAYTNLRRARRAPYFRIRRDAARHGWRWVIVLIAAVGGLIGSLSARSIVPPPEGTLRTLFLASLTGVSSGITAARTPVDLNTTFPAGIPRVYYWFEFENVTEGISWSQVLLLNGSAIRSESEEWNRGESGSAYYWFGAQGGWPAGTYEIQFYLGDRLMSSATYTIQD
jgi:hypothetical protein